MRKILKLSVAFIAVLFSSSAFCQRHISDFEIQRAFPDLKKKWTDYKTNEADQNFLSLYSTLYRESVSLEEMKQAFYKNRNAKAKDKEIHYDDFVVIKPELHPEDIYVRVYPTLKDHPEKQVEEGERIMLSNPKWYMGFVVSPRAYFDVYNNGKRTISAPYAYYSDFFAYATYNPVLQLDGPYNWSWKTSWGARMIGQLHAMRTDEHWWLKDEKQFSVLLYIKKDEYKVQDYQGIHTHVRREYYSLELLEPEVPDAETKKLFEDLKEFVEKIPFGAFAPYFTTDLRQMTGRYYKVTVNRCGWLTTDYL